MDIRPTTTQYPTYRIPDRLKLNLVGSALFNRRRWFKSDAEMALKGLNPPPVVSGQENLPRGGPCLVTMNHYYRPGFGAWWIALAISAIIPFDIHWIMTGAFTYPGQRREAVLKPLSRWALHRIGMVYGFTNMPAMPPNPGEVHERAQAVRDVIGYIRGCQDAVVGLAPEGRDILTGQLGDPPSGSGRFMLYLASMSLPFLPVGVFEHEGLFKINIGPLYRLGVPAGLSSVDTDQAVNLVVMGAIARLLPEGMRGIYG